MTIAFSLMPSFLSPSAQRAFRRCLSHELAERCQRNPRYSIRAFAIWLRVDHSTLAKLLRGIRPVSGSTVVRLGTRLGFDRAQIQEYLVGRVTPPADDGPPLPAAILGLVTRPGFRPDCRWIARALGTTPDDVNRVLPDLLRSRQLAMVGRRRWSRSAPQ